MKVGCRQKRVDPAAFGRRKGTGGFIDILGTATRQRGNHGTAHFAGDVRDGVGVGRRRDRESCLDDVHAQRVQRAGHLHLGRHFQRKARRLLPVAQRGVEDSDTGGVVRHVLSLRRGD